MKALPPFRLHPEALTDEGRHLRRSEFVNPELGQRHRLGGEPDFIQKEEWPSCSCGEKMTFYAQLDAIGEEYGIADMGLIYIFLCFGCFETESFVQSH